MTSGAVFWTFGYQFSKTITMTKGFRMYPPVMRPSMPLVKIAKMSQSITAGALNPRKYIPLRLAERLRLSSDTYRFVFHLSNPTDTLGLPIGQHVHIRADIDGTTITRSYTPISSNADLGRMDLTIKVYPDGKMGNYLLNLPLDSSVQIRGPSGHFKNYHRFLCDNMAMIAGGTGITPMYQLLRHICMNDADETRITLVYATRSEDDILLREEIDSLAARYPTKLKVHYFLAFPPANGTWTGDVGFVTLAKMKRYLPKVCEGSKYLVCGPEGMVGAVSKNLVEMGCEKPKLAGHPTDQVFVF